MPRRHLPWCVFVFAALLSARATEARQVGGGARVVQLPAKSSSGAGAERGARLRGRGRSRLLVHDGQKLLVKLDGSRGDQHGTGAAFIPLDKWKVRGAVWIQDADGALHWRGGADPVIAALAGVMRARGLRAIVSTDVDCPACSKMARRLVQVDTAARFRARLGYRAEPPPGDIGFFHHDSPLGVYLREALGPALQVVGSERQGRSEMLMIRRRGRRGLIVSSGARVPFDAMSEADRGGLEGQLARRVPRWMRTASYQVASTLRHAHHQLVARPEPDGQACNMEFGRRMLTEWSFPDELGEHILSSASPR